MAVYDFNGKLMATPGWGGTAVNGGAGISTLTGTSGADNLNPFGATTMVGLGGNDIYQYVTMATKVVEAAGGGIDTVYVNASYVMPDNVENLTVWWADSVFGNDLGNVMIGNGAAQLIDGGAGNDWLKGGGAHDTFRFSAGSGKDVVADFTTASALTAGTDSDLVRLAGYAQFTSFAQVRQAMSQVGNDVVLQLDGSDAVKFLNHTIADFGASDFLLGLDRSNLVMTFDEEFDSLSLWNGVSGAGSQGTWRTDYGWGATRDSLASRQLGSESQVFVDPGFKGAGTTALGLNPFSMANGEVTITASPTPTDLAAQVYNQPYISGLLTTRPSFAQTYGYFEAKIDIPQGSGTWPAFWLIPADGSWPPELDIMENYGGATTSYTAHSGTRTAHVSSMNSVWDPAVAQGSHVFGLMWTAQTITWYLDGVAIYSIDTPAGMNKPMYMVLDLAIQKGAPAGQTASMTVDWVHAYQIADPDAPPPAVIAPLAPTGLANSAIVSGYVNAAQDTGAQALTGTAGAGTTITVYDGATTLGTAIADATTGAWSYTLGVLADGGHSLTATATDAAGLVSAASSALAFEVDTAAPSAPAALANAAIVGGTVDADHDTSAQALTGTAEAGATINVYDDAGMLGTTTADAVTGAWSYTLGVLADGAHSLTAIATDAAGNASAASSALAFTVDTSPPAPDPVIQGLTITGTASADKLIGGAGADFLVGLDGNDWLDGGAGADTMAGGNGSDTYVVDDAGDVITEDVGGGNDMVRASVAYTLSANVENMVFSGSGSWTGTGNGLANTISGSGGSDTILGLGGNDDLRGGSGDDVLVGGQGGDILTGGTGADRFVFASTSESSPRLYDRITDFHSWEGDRIDLSGIDTAATLAGNEPFAWIGSAGFSHSAGELRFQTGAGGVTVQGDLNGDGIPDFAIWVAGVTSLAAGDFIL